MRAFVETILADDRIEIPAATVIDVGIIRGRGWAVVEQNAAWGSGLYGCDPLKVLEVLRSATVANSI
jgi:ATP-grasp domain, R2K clade family 2